MDWRQPEGGPVRGSILFAGGRGDFIEKYLEPYRHWHDRGWNVTAFDWRGQGRSRGDIVGGHLPDFSILIDDLTVLMEDFRAANPGPYVAVGHSMGGHMLLRTLVEKQPALDAAVLIAPMILINSAPFPRSFAAPLASLFSRIGWARRPLWRPAPPAPPGSPRQSVLTSCPERYADELWWCGREPGFNLGAPSWGWIRAAYRSAAEFFTAEKLATVTTPLLVLATERDRLVSPAAIRRAVRHLADARLQMYPDAGHEILRESDPIRLDALARIDSFLDERAA